MASPHVNYAMFDGVSWDDMVTCVYDVADTFCPRCCQACEGQTQNFAYHIALSKWKDKNRKNACSVGEGGTDLPMELIREMACCVLDLDGFKDPALRITSVHVGRDSFLMGLAGHRGLLPPKEDGETYTDAAIRLLREKQVTDGEHLAEVAKHDDVKDIFDMGFIDPTPSDIRMWMRMARVASKARNRHARWFKKVRAEVDGEDIEDEEVQVVLAYARMKSGEEAQEDPEEEEDYVGPQPYKMEPQVREPPEEEEAVEMKRKIEVEMRDAMPDMPSWVYQEPQQKKPKLDR